MIHMSLSEFVHSDTGPEQTLVLENRKLVNQPVVEVIKGLFEGQRVDVRVEDRPNHPSDRLVLQRGGDTIARSSVNDLFDSVLLVEPADFVNGQIPLSEVTLPEVVAALKATTFRVDSHAKSGIEKLLFVAISRYIEKLAFEGEGGTLRAGFQQLSRIQREEGTEAVYRELGKTGVDVHVYGVPDWIPPEEFDAKIHAGYGEEFSDHWFVVYEAPADAQTEDMAFLSTALDSGRWEGFWTSDAELVGEMGKHIETTM